MVVMLVSVVGGVFIVFALMALCYRSVVVHRNLSLCLRLVESFHHARVRFCCVDALSLSLSLSLFDALAIYAPLKQRQKKNHHSILYSITILFCRLLPATILFFSVIILFSLFHHLLRIRIQHVQSRRTL